MEGKERLRQELLNNGFDCYSFSIASDSEIAVCEKLNRKHDNAYFLTLRKMMHKSKDGIRYDIQSLMLEKHVFVYVRKDESIDFMNDYKGLLRMNKSNDTGKLTGKDYEYAKWVLEINGLIGMSTAVLKEGPTTVITSGPLLKLHDYIIKYARRNRNCLISMNLAGNKIETWLPFVWENEINDQAYKQVS